MTHANRGKALERRCLRAARDYATAGVGWWHHSPPPTTLGPGGIIIHVAKAGVDLLGLERDAVGSALELKETRGVSLPLADITAGQMRVLDTFVKLGGRAALIIAYRAIDPDGETFILPWKHARTVTWRESISIDFARAYGELVDDVRTDDGACYFMTRRQHPAHDAARIAVSEEMARPRALADPEEVPPQLTLPAPKRSVEQIRESLRASVNEGVQRQLGKRRGRFR
jgi:penicillin-binding protein-related factor A (putative recombinase)